ncbi:hypothetical protein BDY21DRAFT_301102, partial [Lineolata rhizophorae]
MSSSQSELASPPHDAISAVTFAPSGPQLLVSSWDRHIYHYETNANDGSGVLLKTIEHPAPVLDVCFGRADRGEAFSAGVDWAVRRIDL